jgi:hypothetical protein
MVVLVVVIVAVIAAVANSRKKDSRMGFLYGTPTACVVTKNRVAMSCGHSSQHTCFTTIPADRSQVTSTVTKIEKT